MPEGMQQAFLETLSMTGFRNYTSAELGFINGVNVLWGPNGAGKTNVLDAIHYLCLTKSFLNQSDQQNIKSGEPLFIIRGVFNSSGEKLPVVCSVKQDEKKILRCNDENYRTLSEHIGKFPLVAVLPGDFSMINEGSDKRRKFTDGVIAQYNAGFLENLMQYQVVLEQRNKYLKQVRENPSLTLSLLEVYNGQLEAAGLPVHAGRREFLERLGPVFSDCYNSISGSHDHATLGFVSGFEGSSLQDELERCVKKDIASGFTSVGIHRDDLEFSLNGLPLKRFASQGQQKSFLVALRIASYRMLQQELRACPILLIDDFSDKLDAGRKERLASLLSQQGTGQVFITDTSDTAALFRNAGHTQVKDIPLGRTL